MKGHPPSLKIGVSGVRGIAGTSLTPEIVAAFSAAFGTYCGPGPIAIGTDTRPSRVIVAPAVTAGLLSVGCVPVQLGVVPTPTLQFHVHQHGEAGGISITASHNPEEWNALKFCTGAGEALRPYQFSELLDLYHQGVYARVDADRVPEIRDDRDAVAEHLRAVTAFVDVASIKRRGFRVVVDCCNAAASEVTPGFLRDLGCEVIEIHTDPDQPFPRDPEPVADHLSALSAAVLAHEADIGFAQDADADRLALVDELGRPPGEDFTVALAARRVLQERPGPVVVSVSTSRMIESIADARGCPVYRCPVGEAHVLEKMAEVGAPVGGEGNGGVIVPEINRCRDSFVAIALVLEHLVREGSPVSRVLASLPPCGITKVSVPCRSRDASAYLRLMKRVYGDAELDLTDGVKVNWPDRWLLIRASNTEPLVRLTAEAEDPTEARRLIDAALEYFRPFAPDAG
jgi:phosphomannomutase